MKLFRKIGLLLCLVGLTGCSNNTMTWADAEKDINKAIENGWHFYHENTDENKLAFEKENETAFKKELNKDYDITILSVCALTYDKGKIMVFCEFANSNEPEWIYELYSSREGNWMKVYISGSILIETNCQEGVDLLGYTFK